MATLVSSLPARLRSVLFAPAVRPDLVAKLSRTAADAVVIDLEDATPVAQKDPARTALGELVASVDERLRVMVRVNDVHTDWFAADMAALPDRVVAVVVPKIETAADLEMLESTRAALDRPDIAVIGGFETARGVADARDLLSHGVLAGGYFGAEDFIADMGGARTASNAEVHTARSLVALAGRLAEKPVLDQVVTDFRDDERMRREASEAAAMGYSGKLCIHPGQVDSANAAWTPSADDVERARRLVAAYEEAAAGGVAAIDFEGQMVDEPVAVQARRLISRADV